MDWKLYKTEDLLQCRGKRVKVGIDIGCCKGHSLKEKGVVRVGKKHSPGRLIENGAMDQDLDPAQSQGGKTNLRREIRMKEQIPFPMVKLFHSFAQALSDNNSFAPFRAAISDRA
ncbi:hypothetical protein ACOSP7_028281 [Xanthoceras sorbifolium]